MFTGGFLKTEIIFLGAMRNWRLGHTVAAQQQFEAGIKWLANNAKLVKDDPIAWLDAENFWADDQSLMAREILPPPCATGR